MNLYEAIPNVAHIQSCAESKQCTEPSMKQVEQKSAPRLQSCNIEWYRSFNDANKYVSIKQPCCARAIWRKGEFSL